MFQVERRARSAQLERERRGELSEAKADLGAAAGCKASVSVLYHIIQMFFFFYEGIKYLGVNNLMYIFPYISFDFHRLQARWF